MIVLLKFVLKKLCNLSPQEWGSHVLVQSALGESQSFGNAASVHSSTSLHSQPSVRGRAFSAIGAVDGCKAKEGRYKATWKRESKLT